jgi:hypothetical protein
MDAGNNYECMIVDENVSTFDSYCLPPGYCSVYSGASNDVARCEELATKKPGFCQENIGDRDDSICYKLDTMFNRIGRKKITFGCLGA